MSTAVNGAPTSGSAAQERPEPRSWVTTVILLRHGRSTANTSGVLAGRTPGINLDDTGRSQAAGIAERLADVAIDRIVSSPLERCQQTLAPLAAATGLTVEVDDRLAEVDYGDWAVPPDESDGPNGSDAPGKSSDGTAKGPIARTVLICSHGDVIKALLADALGLHLDSFQRIVVAPASLSVIRYTPLRPFVERINDTGELRSLGSHPVPRLREDPPHDRPSEDPQPDAASEAVPGGVTR